MVAKLEKNLKRKVKAGTGPKKVENLAQRLSKRTEQDIEITRSKYNVPMLASEVSSAFNFSNAAKD